MRTLKLLGMRLRLAVLHLNTEDGTAVSGEVLEFKAAGNAEMLLFDLV